MPLPALPLDALLTGRARPFTRPGSRSGIAKSPRDGALRVTPVGLEGDEQGDLRVHGGVEKAIHHYPREHYAAWIAELGEHPLLMQAGAFGENFSTSGWSEADVCLGDRVRAGTALLEVSQGRMPCWKLNDRFEVAGMSLRVQESGRTGWYYRVLEEGVVAAGDILQLVERRHPDWSLLRLSEVLFDRRADAEYGWCAAIRGAEGGGAVEGLPAHTFRTSSGDLSLKCPTEVAITDRREKELNDLGFISLCHKKNSDVAVFFGGQTTNKARLYNTNEANANARLSAMLPYVLAASRFAHYLKVIMRDKVGSFMTRDNVQTYLNNWIADYVLINDNAPQEIKAQYPLREARVDVSEVAGKPGAYRATVFLRPHFQLEELSASIRLVANLPPPVAA